MAALLDGSIDSLGSLWRLRASVAVAAAWSIFDIIIMLYCRYDTIRQRQRMSYVITTLSQHLINNHNIVTTYNIHTTFIQHLYTTLSQHSYNIYTTFIQHSYNIHTTFIQHLYNIERGRYGDFSKDISQRKKYIFHLYCTWIDFLSCWRMSDMLQSRYRTKTTYMFAKYEFVHDLPAPIRRS